LYTVVINVTVWQIKVIVMQCIPRKQYMNRLCYYINTTKLHVINKMNIEMLKIIIA